jgi:hypothetical protein
MEPAPQPDWNAPIRTARRPRRSRIWAASWARWRPRSGPSRGRAPRMSPSPRPCPPRWWTTPWPRPSPASRRPRGAHRDHHDRRRDRPGRGPPSPPEPEDGHAGLDLRGLALGINLGRFLSRDAAERELIGSALSEPRHWARAAPRGPALGGFDANVMGLSRDEATSPAAASSPAAPPAHGRHGRVVPPLCGGRRGLRGPPFLFRRPAPSETPPPSRCGVLRLGFPNDLRRGPSSTTSPSFITMTRCAMARSP